MVSNKSLVGSVSVTVEKAYLQPDGSEWLRDVSCRPWLPPARGHLLPKLLPPYLPVNKSLLYQDLTFALKIAGTWFVVERSAQYLFPCVVTGNVTRRPTTRAMHTKGSRFRQPGSSRDRTCCRVRTCGCGVVSREVLWKRSGPDAVTISRAAGPQ